MTPKELEDKLFIINQFIIDNNKELYKSIFHIANPTLSRNPYMSKFLVYFLGYEKVKNINLLDKLKILFKYLMKSNIRFMFYLLRFFTYKMYRKKYRQKINIDYLIDINFILKNIIKNNSIEDTHYFREIDNRLEKLGYKSAYLVKSFIGYDFNISKFIQGIGIINKSDKLVFTEFDYLDFFDLLKIFFYINIYPFKLMAIKFKGDKELIKILTTSNIEALNDTSYTRFVRYITGLKIASFFDEIKIISHCEYKCHDKIFYKGVKDLNKKIYIYGCQFFISYPVWLNIKIPLEEKIFNLTPDIVLTNGEIDVAKHGIVAKKGFSLRYDYLFQNKKNNPCNNEENILILLSFMKNISENIINMCLDSEIIKNKKVIVRSHPVVDINAFVHKLPTNWEIDSNPDINESFSKSSLIITSGTGSALEAVVSRMSVIIVVDKTTFTTNPLSYKLGKGVVWDEACDTKELEVAYNKLIQNRKDNYKNIVDLSNEYLALFFSEPTEENIIDSFIKLRSE